MQTKVTCSFLEIYNETISDLLVSESTTGLPLREDARRGVFVEGLSEAQVFSISDVAQLLHCGVANRRVGETLMNERSSRSHSVFTAAVERRTPGINGGPDTVLRSRLHLVDLAGSERQKATGAAGERLKEASSINKSLSTLGLVIMSLVDQQQGRQRHIPYRDSKLTTLLRDSLGGNAKTVMIACISPAAINSAETLGTLRFADGAKRIKNKAVVNEDAEGDAESLRREVRRLKEELAMAKTAAADAVRLGPETEPITPVRSTPGGEWGGPPLSAMATGMGGEGFRRALVGALRREEVAAVQIAALQEEIAGMRSLVAARDADLQRTHMMLKLKDSRLARVPPSHDDVVIALTSEIELLKGKLEAHPEVRRFAVENLHLAQEVERLRAMVDHHELSRLHAELTALRREMLGLVEMAETAEEEAARSRAEAEAARAAAEGSTLALREAQARVRDHELQPALQQRVKDLESENDELKLAVAGAGELRGEADRLCAHAADLEFQCESLKAALETKSEESNQATTRGKLLESQCESLTAALGAKSQEANELGARSEQLAAQCSSLEAALQEKTQEANDAYMAHSRVSEELCTVREQLIAAEAAHKDAQANLAATRAEASEHRAELESTIASANAELQQRALDTERLNNEVCTLREQLAAAEAAFNQSQTTLAATVADASKEKAELEAAVASLRGQVDHNLVDIEGLEKKLQARRARVEELEAAVHALSEERDALVEDLVAKEKEAEEASTKATDLEIQLEETQTKLQAAENAVDNLQTEVKQQSSRAQQAEQAAICATGQIKELTAQLETKSATLEVTQTQLTASKKELGALQAAAAMTGAELATCQASLTAATEEVEKLRSTLEAAEKSHQEEAEQLTEELRAVEGEKDELEFELSDKSASLMEAKEQLATTRAALKQSKSEEEKASARVVELTADLRAARQKGDSIERQRVVLENKVILLEEEIREVRSELTSARTGPLEKEQQLLQARAELAETKAQLAKAKGEAQVLAVGMKKKEDEVVRVRAQMAAEVSDAAHQVQELLAAQARAEAAEERAAELARRLRPVSLGGA